MSAVVTGLVGLSINLALWWCAWALEPLFLVLWHIVVCQCSQYWQECCE